MFAKIKYWIMYPFEYRRKKQEEKEREERLKKRIEELRKRDPFIYE